MADALVEEAVAVYNSILQAPETDDVPAEITQGIHDLTLEDTQARKLFNDQTELAFNDEFAMRGDVLGQRHGDVTVEGGVLTSIACLSIVADEDDDPNNGVAGDGTWSEYEIRAGQLGNEWLLTDLEERRFQDESDDEGGLAGNCVPADVQREVSEAWESWVVAEARYVADPGNDALRQEAATHWTGGDMPDFGLETANMADISIDLHVAAARRSEVEVTWCLDPSRNTDATFTPVGGTAQPIEPIGRYGTWVQGNGRWLLESFGSGGKESENPVAMVAFERCVES